jgi:hypothetical protein
MLVSSLKGRATFSRQDGTIMDFREQGLGIFVIDKRSKILKPDKEFMVNFELVTPVTDNFKRDVVQTKIDGDVFEEHF